MKMNKIFLVGFGCILTALFAFMTLPALATDEETLTVEVISMQGVTSAGLHFINDEGIEEELVTIQAGVTASHDRQTLGDYTLEVSYSTKTLSCVFENDGSQAIIFGKTKVLLALNTDENTCLLSDEVLVMDIESMNFPGYSLNDLRLGYGQELKNADWVLEEFPLNEVVGEKVITPLSYNNVDVKYTIVFIYHKDYNNHPYAECLFPNGEQIIMPDIEQLKVNAYYDANQFICNLTQ